MSSMHPLAQDALYRLTAEIGDRETLQEFFVRFWGRLEELDRLARRERRRPASQDDLERLDLPLDCGGVLLYRPTVGGMNWLRTKAAEWWGDNVRKYTLALAYVCAHRGKESIASVRRRFAAWMRIKAWAIGTRAGEEALRRAAVSLLPPPDDALAWFYMPGDEACAGMDLAQVALALSKEYGQTPGHWLWEVADDDFWGAFCGMLDQAEAADDKHEDENGWWRLHRRALARCEQALERDVKAWLAREEAHHA